MTEIKEIDDTVRKKYQKESRKIEEESGDNGRC